MVDRDSSNKPETGTHIEDSSKNYLNALGKFHDSFSRELLGNILSEITDYKIALLAKDTINNMKDSELANAARHLIYFENNVELVNRHLEAGYTISDIFWRENLKMIKFYRDIIERVIILNPVQRENTHASRADKDESCQFRTKLDKFYEELFKTSRENIDVESLSKFLEKDLNEDEVCQYRTMSERIDKIITNLSDKDFGVEILAKVIVKDCDVNKLWQFKTWIDDNLAESIKMSVCNLDDEILATSIREIFKGMDDLILGQQVRNLLEEKSTGIFINNNVIQQILGHISQNGDKELLKRQAELEDKVTKLSQNNIENKTASDYIPQFADIKGIKPGSIKIVVDLRRSKCKQLYIKINDIEVIGGFDLLDLVTKRGNPRKEIQELFLKLLCLKSKYKKIRKAVESQFLSDIMDPSKRKMLNKRVNQINQKFRKRLPIGKYKAVRKPQGQIPTPIFNGCIYIGKQISDYFQEIKQADIESKL